MQSRTAIVREDYNGLASNYDSRWAEYLRATHKVTMELLRPAQGDSILDASAGTGLLAQAILKRTNGKVRLALSDISEGMLRVARNRLKLFPKVKITLQDVHKTTFRSGSFSHIVSASAFHYYADANGVLKEFHRLLKRDGVLVITDWSRDTIRFKIYDVFLRIFRPAHGLIYNRAELTSLLKANGFVVKEDRQFSSGLWSLMTVRATKK